MIKTTEQNNRHDRRCAICKRFLKKGYTKIVCSEECSIKLLERKSGRKESGEIDRDLPNQFLRMLKASYAKSLEKKRWKSYRCAICDKTGERLNLTREKKPRMLCDECYGKKIFIE